MTDQIRIREAGPSDVHVVLHHRRSMFVDMGFTDTVALAAMLATSESYLARGLAEGLYRGWLAELPSGEVVAGGGIVITAWPSHPRDAQPRRAEILNVYTEPAYRRRGLARRLMVIMIGWCREQGLASVFLHASDDGRPLYETLGFRPTNEMRLEMK